jgi:4-azaleucine resistance transporter AzlC
VIPFALIVGISAVGSGLSSVEGIGMSLVVFAGASQLAGLQLIAASASVVVIVFTVWVINVRFMLYSASLGVHFKDLPFPWKAGLAWLLTDQAYAVSIVEFENNPDNPHKKWFYLGACVVMWAVYILGTAVGVLVGAQIPESWSLDFAIPLTFIALAIPAIKHRADLVAGVLAGGITTFGVGLPYNLGLPLGVLVGIGVGMLLEGNQK